MTADASQRIPPQPSHWRPMTVEDLDTVLSIADQVHQDYPEDLAVFADRLALFPDGCGVAVADGQAVGYHIMHPGVLGRPPGLNKPLGRLPPNADCFYIHDIALLPMARKAGLGRMAAADAMEIAAIHGFHHIALIATPGALAYWRAAGYRDYPQPPDLSSYGAGLAYLWKPVQAE